MGLASSPVPPHLPAGPRSNQRLPWWRQWRTRLFAAFLFLALVGGSIEGLETWRLRRAVEAEALAAQAEAARNLARATRSFMGRYEAAAASLANTVFAQPHSPLDRHPLLEAVEAAFPELDIVFVTDRHGRIRDASRAGAVGIDVSGRDYFRRLAAGERSTAMEVVVGEVSNRLQVGVAAASRAQDGSLLGAVVIGVSVSALNEDLRALTRGGSYPLAIDRNGHVVAHGSEPDLDWAQRDYSRTSPVAEALAGTAVRTTRFPDPLTGRPSLGAMVPVPELGWAVGVLRPVEEAGATAHPGVRRSFASTLAAVALGLGLTLVLTGRLARPLTALSRGVAALRQGELSHRVGVRGRDEFGELGESFDRMAADLDAHVAALQESEARLEAIVQSTPAVIYLVDAESRFVHVNRQFEALFQTSMAELEGRSVYDVFPPGSAAAFEANNRAVLEAGHPLEFEERVDLPDGPHVYRSIKAPVLGPEGRPVGLACVSVDVTDRKHAEAARAKAQDSTAELARVNEALHQRLVQIQTLLDVSPIGIGMAEDAGGRCILANPALARMLGVEPWTNISKSAFPGVPLPFTLYRDGRPLSTDELPLEHALAHGVPIANSEIEVVTGDGRRLHLLEWATPFFDAQQRVRGGFLAVIDITERKRAEQGQRFLAEASAILASSLDYEATLGVIAGLAVPAIADWCVVDLVDGERTRRVGVAHADPASADTAEAFRSVTPGRPGADPVAAALASGKAQLLPEVDDAMLRTIVASYDAHYRTLRAVAPRSWVTVPLTTRGRPVGALTLIAAESGRRYGEADVALAEELARRVALAIENTSLYREAQEAVRARELFFAAASHELRTPLTSAVGALRLVKRAMAGELREAPEELVDIANRNLDAMLVLVNDLLDATRLTARPDAPARQSVALRPLVARALDLVAIQAREKEVAIDLAVPRDLAVAGDAEKLEHVVVNLLANAVRHSRAGGTVTIEGGRAGDDVVFRVRDQGDGIAADDLERIFEPFFRTPRRGRRDRGTGLGLPICRQIVTLHGGRVWAESDGLGQGSTFVVALPGVSTASRAA